MNKNKHISSLDLHQMQMRTFDESVDAQRVTIIGQEIQLNTDMLKNAITEGLKDIKITANSEQKALQVIEIPTIIKETIVEKVEVPVIVHENRIIEVPVIVPELKIIEIEKPILVTEVKIIEVVKENFNKTFLYLNVGLSILNILILIGKLIK